jgi:site-specific DNA recombinase
MKAVILIRVSSKDQEDNYSLDAQSERLKEYCERKGFIDTIEFRIVESSSRGNRKQFNEMITYIKKQRKTIALVADAIDRVQRGFKESILLDEMRIKNQIELHFLRENLIINEKSSPSEIVMWDYGVVGAKSYIVNLSSNVRRGNQQKLNSGEYTGDSPIGYLNYRDEHDKSQIKVDQVRSPLIKQAFKQYSSGSYSIKQIADFLKENGLVSKTTAENPITSSGVHRMLQNPFYYGYMFVKEKLYKHKYEPLIEEWLFRKCEDIRQGYKKKPFKSDAKNFIFKGLLRNKETGRILSGDIKKSKYIYYYSPKYKDSPASQVVKEEVVLKQIEKIFNKITIPKEVLEQIKDRLKQTHESKKVFHDDMVRDIQKRSRKIQGKLDKLLDLRLEDDLSQEMYNQKSDELKRQQKDLELKLHNLNDADEKFAITLSYLLDVSSRASELFKSSKVEQKRQLINFVLSNLLMDGDKLLYTVNKPFDVLMKCEKHSDWLGMRDSNPRMSAPKADALPLGESPTILVML